MYGEFTVYGVFIPTLLGLMLLAYLLLNGLRLLLQRFGFYRFIWHPPLFDFALYVLMLGALVDLLHKGVHA